MRKLESGLPLTNRSGGSVPFKVSITAPHTSAKTRSPASSVDPPMCGVHTTFGSLRDEQRDAVNAQHFGPPSHKGGIRCHNSSSTVYMCSRDTDTEIGQSRIAS